MDDVREALREGLREEAAPISRRLAEVKGLSNNTIRRLERIEATLDAERSARVDDLALLVELLTEGWRAMNARLQRIEALLQPAGAPTAEVYRLTDRFPPTADAGETAEPAGSTSSKREPRPTSESSSRPPPSAAD